MDYKNKLMYSLLSVLAILSACTDERENDLQGTGGGKSGTPMTFVVGMKEGDTWKDVNLKSRCYISDTPPTDFPTYSQNIVPIKMQGKIGNKAVYITPRVTDRWAGNKAASRGTQISAANAVRQMEAFGVSAYTDMQGKADYMYNEKLTKDAAADTWTTHPQFFWPYHPLDIFAWYPYEGEGFSVSDAEAQGYPVLSYTVPEDASKQKDVMWARTTSAAGGTLDFEHLLTAVKFVVGDDLPNCVIKSVTLANVRYKGTCSFETDRVWNLANDTKHFKQEWKDGKELEGNAGETITDADETFFMLPQTLPANAKVVVVLNNGVEDFTASASIAGTEWPVGECVTYRISHNFVSLTLTNNLFVPIAEGEIKNQLAFYVSFESSWTADSARFQTPDGVTFSPASIPSGAKNQPVYISMPDARYVVMYMTVGKSKKGDGFGLPDDKTPAINIGVARILPAEADSAYLSSVPDIASMPFTGILSMKNASGADWIGMTNQSTYDDVDYRKNIITNAHATDGKVWLQTLSAAKEYRTASLLVKRKPVTTNYYWTDFEGNPHRFQLDQENVMVMVEQKPLTADFGFKDCERNISREAEKWDIVLSGGRFRSGTKVKARVVMDAGQAGVTGDGSLTYGEDAVITCDSTGGSGVYVKKRWDTQQNNAANNGTRAVHVQVQDEYTKQWYDVAGTGTMADWNTWGTNYCLGRGEYKDNGGNKYDNIVTPIFTQYWEVHENHPFFGKYKENEKTAGWACFSVDTKTDKDTNPMYRVYSAVNGINGEGNKTLHGHNVSGWGHYMMITCNSYSDYKMGNTQVVDNVAYGPVYSAYSQPFCDGINKKGRGYGDTSASCVVIPTIYLNGPDS